MSDPHAKYHGLFLETSAQMFRLSGSREMKACIQDRISCAHVLGTSEFVLQEFREALGKTYRSIFEALDRLPRPSQPRTILDMWREIVELMPAFISAGGKLLSQLSMALGSKYGGRLVTAQEVSAFLIGQLAWLERQVELIDGRSIRDIGVVVDETRCCVWPTSSVAPCEASPQPECRLQRLCIENKRFRSSARHVATSSLSEAKGVRRANLGARGLKFLREIGSRPNAFGDLVIFWEVPQDWAILTRDRGFLELQANFRTDLTVVYVRWLRSRGAIPCTLELPGKRASAVAGEIVNWTSRDARVRISSTDAHLVRRRRNVQVTCTELDIKHAGRVITREVDEDAVSIGVRLDRGLGRKWMLDTQ